MAEMAKIVGGRPLEIVVATGLLLKLCMSCSPVIVTLSVIFNSVTRHAMCTVSLSAFATVVCWAASLPRTFKFVAQVGVISTTSILMAVFIAIIGLGVAGHPNGTSADWAREITVVGRPSFVAGVSACLKICYAFAGNVAYISYMAEMRNPSKDFAPALAVLQISSVLLYIVTTVPIYCLSGQFVRSPALGSTPDLPARIAFGAALPAVLATGLAFGHTAIKYMYLLVLQALNATHRATENSATPWSIWVSCATAFWLVCFLVANAILVFDSIISISSAIFVSWFAFGISGIFWYYRNWREKLYP
ncbi:hypothetical protein VHEMI06116 [[Torrubiella] hemipterigena]|uniref:Amino acid transporter transmembrane domain-containing protein n=1 Tax=[Torrubiella] hemipterigena TaxID=1531966 RepID=A0A0A1TIA9_9HYPO|nr:hypothetical protein VHEMI06116 [[Torrubiella] hemipterigena]